MANFCGNCGERLGDREKFCPRCGKEIENFSIPNSPTYANESNVNYTVQKPKEQKPKREKMSRGKKAKIISILIALALLALAIYGAVLYFFGSAYSVKKEFDDGNYDNALAIYEANVKDDFIQGLFAKFSLEGQADQILTTFKNGEIEYEDAVSALECLQEMGFTHASDIITEITDENTANTAYDSANAYYEKGDYENAIKEYSKIPDSSEKYENAQTKLNELYPKYSQSVIQEAERLAGSQDYLAAISYIDVALSLVPDESANVAELNSTRATCLDHYKQAVLEDITSLINEKKYTDAINLANEALEIDDNEDFQKVKATAETEYVKNISASVKGYLAKEDYVSAERTINSALGVLPDNAELKNLQQEVTAQTPVYFLDVCKPYSKDDYYYTEYVNGETFLMGGTSYTNGFTLGVTLGGTNNAIFNLNNQYKSLSFLVGHVDETDMGDAQIKIYLDGVLKKEYNASAEALPQKMTIDLTGVNQLKIEVTDTNNWFPKYGFGNMIVK